MKILVLCTGNSCRSQMAEGYLKHFLKGRAEVYSAGIEAHGMNPEAVKVMAEDGIDISGHTSDSISSYENLLFHHVMTVCDNAKERCPYFPASVQAHHKNFPDPAKATGTDEEIRQQFRQVRDLIREYCRGFFI